MRDTHLLGLSRLHWAALLPDRAKRQPPVRDWQLGALRAGLRRCDFARVCAESRSL